MHNLANYYDYDFSILDRDEENFPHKYKDYEPTIKRLRE